MTVDRPNLLAIWDVSLGAYKPTPEPLCVVTVGESAELCGRSVHRRIGGAGFCESHYLAAAKWRDELPPKIRERNATDAHQHELAEIGRIAAHRLVIEKRRRDLNIIYYLRRGDGLIKIGTSHNFGSRLSRLRKEYGDLQILLTHSGGYERERELHGKFAELGVGGEWFLARKRLTNWIKKCRLNPEYATQVRGTVDMGVIRALATEGIRASLAYGAAERARMDAETERAIELICQGALEPLAAQAADSEAVA